MEGGKRQREKNNKIKTKQTNKKYQEISPFQNKNFVDVITIINYSVSRDEYKLPARGVS